MTVNYKKAKDEALGLIKKLAYMEPPVNPIDIANAIGMKVHFVTFSGLDNVSGFYDALENSIYVNENESPVRQTFTIAHEIGHKVLHEEWAKSTEYKVLLRESLELPSKDPREQEANSFAANLLVPRFMLDKYKDFATVAELSNLFMVSRPVIQNRLRFEYGGY